VTKFSFYFNRFMYIQTFEFLSGLKLEIFDRSGISAGYLFFCLIVGFSIAMDGQNRISGLFGGKNQASSSMVDPLWHLLPIIATSGSWLHYVCKHYLCDVDIVFVSCMVYAPFCVLLLLNEFVILESFFLLADDISGVFLTK